MAENAFWSGAKHTFSETDLNHFKTWRSVRSIPIYAYQQFEGDYAREVFDMLATLTDGEQEKFFSAMKEPFLGHTTESYAEAKRTVALGEDGPFIETTPWVLKSAHHLLTYFTNSTWKLNDFAQIVEFGPGIGEVCRLTHDLGFKGDYYLYDLPEVLKISSYYNPHAKPVTHFSQIDNTKKTLFIATWSISEVPFDTRNEIVTHFKDVAEFLIIYQNQAFEYQNGPYFMITFPSLIGGREVMIKDIHFLSHIAGGNYYLITK